MQVIYHIKLVSITNNTYNIIREIADAFSKVRYTKKDKREIQLTLNWEKEFNRDGVLEVYQMWRQRQTYITNIKQNTKHWQCNQKHISEETWEEQRHEYQEHGSEKQKIFIE